MNELDPQWRLDGNLIQFFEIHVSIITIFETSEVPSPYMPVKLDFFAQFSISSSSRILWGMSLVNKTPLFAGKFIREMYCIDKTLQKPLSFSGQWTFYMTFPKNDSLCHDLWRHRTLRHGQTGHTTWKVEI